MPSILAMIQDWRAYAPYLAAAFGGGYLLGSIPFGLLFAKLAGISDIRKLGSGNIGATNVLRTGNKLAAAATLLFDAGKGAAAVLIAREYFGDYTAGLFTATAALGAFLGHVFPVWLKFRGGKGVATFFGIELALFLPIGILICLTWLFIARTFRLSSLAALVAALAAPIYFLAWRMAPAPISPFQPAILHLWLTVFFTLMVLVTHRANIARLLRGEEPRIGAGKR